MFNPANYSFFADNDSDSDSIGSHTRSPSVSSIAVTLGDSCCAVANLKASSSALKPSSTLHPSRKKLSAKFAREKKTKAIQSRFGGEHQETIDIQSVIAPYNEKDEGAPEKGTTTGSIRLDYFLSKISSNTFPQRKSSFNEDSGGTDSLGEDGSFVGQRAKVSTGKSIESAVDDTSMSPYTLPPTSTESFTADELSILGSLWRKLPIRGCLALKHKRLDEFLMDDNQIDDIIDSVDAKYMVNMNKGLLSLLHTSSVTKNSADESGGEEDTSNIQDEQIINLDYLTKIFMGEIDRNSMVIELPSDNLVDPVMKKEAQLALLDNTRNKTHGGYNPFEPPPTLIYGNDDEDSSILGHDDGIKIRPQSIAQNIDSKQEIPEQTWWIQELQAEGWFDHDTSTVDLDQIREAVTTENDGERPVTNILSEGGIAVQQDESEEKQGNEGRNDENSKAHDDASTVASEDKNLAVNWEEQLWAAARAHYLEVFPGEDSESSGEHAVSQAEDDLRNENISHSPQSIFNEIDETETRVLRFRNLIKECLLVYVMVFHNDFTVISKFMEPDKDGGSTCDKEIELTSPGDTENQSDSNDASKERNTSLEHLSASLDLPQYVPLNVASSLFKEVVRLNLFPMNERHSRDEVQDVSLEDSIEPSNSFVNKSDQSIIGEPSRLAWLWQGKNNAQDNDHSLGNESGSEESISLEDKKASWKGSPKEEVLLARAVSAVIKAILCTEMGGFQSYYVDFTPYTSGFENSLKDALNFGCESNVDYSSILARSDTSRDKEYVLGQNRVKKRLDMTENKNDQRIEEEKFLYGDGLGDSKEHINNVQPNEQSKEAKESEKEEEISIGKAFMNHLLKVHFKDWYKGNELWSETFVNRVVLCGVCGKLEGKGLFSSLYSMISPNFEINSTVSDENSDMVKVSFRNPSGYSPSLSEAYGLKYAPIILLRSCLAHNDFHFKIDATDNETKNLFITTNCASRKDFKSIIAKVNALEQLLLDPTFAKCRAFVFGPCNSTMDQMSDWQSLRSVQKCVLSSEDYGLPVIINKSIQHGYINEQDRRNYFTSHSAISSILGEIFRDVIEIDDQSNNISIVKSATLNADKRFERLQMLILDSDNIKKSSEQWTYIFTSCLEIGRSLHDIGFRLGRKEKYYQAQHHSRETLAMQTDATMAEMSTRMEISTYELAIDAYREAIRVLAESEATINTFLSAAKGAPLSNLITQGHNDLNKMESHLHHIRELKVSSELYLADVLSAKAFCYDAKLFEHTTAEVHYKEAKSLYTKHLGEFHQAVANTLQNLGTIYFELKNWKDALFCYQNRISILQHLQDKSPKPDQMKNATHEDYSNTNMNIEKEIGYTYQSIARTLIELGRRAEAISLYLDSIRKLRLVGNAEISHTQTRATFGTKINHDQDGYRVNIADTLVEMSNLFLYQAVDLAPTLQGHYFQAMFSHHGISSVVQNYEHSLSSSIQNEKDAKICMIESLYLRGYNTEDRQSLNQLTFIHQHPKLGMVDSFDVSCLDLNLSQTDKSALVRDLMMIGKLNIRQQLYEQAEIDLAKAWKFLLMESSDHSPANDESDVGDNKNSECFVEDEELLSSLNETLICKKYQISIQLLYLMGFVSTRLRKYKRALSCFSVALNISNICSRDIIDYDRPGGICDLAKLNGSIGYLNFKTDNWKAATFHLRKSLRLYDELRNNLNKNSEAEIKSSDVTKQIEGSISISKANIFSSIDAKALDIYLKVAMGSVLYMLGRAYESSKATEKALSFYEHCMLILDGVLGCVQEQYDLNTIDVIHHSAIQHNISPICLGQALGDSYRRSGKIYLTRGLEEDASLAFERSIEIKEGLNNMASFSLQYDEECIFDNLNEGREEGELRELYYLTLNIMKRRNLNAVTEIDEDILKGDNIHFTKEDLLFRLGNYHGKRKEYTAAIKCYKEAELQTIERLGTRDHMIVANILHNMGNVYRDIFLHSNEVSELAKEKAIECLEDTIEIARHTSSENDLLFTIDTMHQLINLRMTAPSEGNIQLRYNNDLLQKCLAVKVQAHGENHFDVASTLESMGNLQYLLGDFKKSIQAFERALSIRKGAHQTSSFDEFNTLHSLGLARVRHAEKINEEKSRSLILQLAQTSFEDALCCISSLEALIDLKLKDNTNFETCKCNISAVKSLYQLALMSQRRGDIDGTLRLFTQLLQKICPLVNIEGWNEAVEEMAVEDIAKSRIGQDYFHMILATTWVEVGLILEMRGRVLESIACFQKSLAAYSFPLTRGKADTVGEQQINDISIQLHLARAWFKCGCHERSSNFYTDSISMLKLQAGDPGLEVAVVLVFMGRNNAISFNEDDALKCYFNALEIFIEVNEVNMPLEEKGIKGILHQGIANIQQKRGEYLLAFEHINYATALIEEVHDKKDLFSSLPSAQHNPADVMCFFEDWNSRLFECYIAILQLTEFVLNDADKKEEAADVVHRIGNLYTSFGLYEEAFQCFFAVLSFWHQLGKERRLGVADLLFNLGNIYLQKHDKVRSRLCHEESYIILSSTLGENSLELIESTILLGNLSCQLRHFKDAMKWSEASLRLMKGNPSDCLPHLSRILHLKGTIHDECGEYKDAVSCLTESLNIGTDSWGSDSLEVSNCFNSLGNVHWKCGEVEYASVCYTKCLTIRCNTKNTLGVANTKNNIGAILVSVGLKHPAQAFYAEALRIKTNELGCDNIEVARTLCNLGQLLIEEHSSKAALKYFKEGIRILRFNLSDSHYEVAVCLYHFGVIYEEEKSYANALDHYLEALHIFQLVNIHNSMVACTLHSVGIIYYQLQDYTRTVDYLQKSITMKLNHFGIDHETTAESQHFLGEVFCKIKNIDSSIKYLNLALNTRMQKYGKASVPVCKTMLALGKSYIQHHDTHQAIDCLESAYALTKITEDCNGNDFLDIQILLGQVYEECGHYCEATRHYSEALLNATGNNISYLLYLIATCEWRNEDYESSRVYLQKAIVINAASYESESGETSKILKKCGEVEQHAKNYKEAITYYEKALLIERKSNKNQSSIYNLVHMLGGCHSLIGSNDKALVYFSESVNRRTLSHGINHPIVHQAKIDVANALVSMGKASDALKLLSEILSECYISSDDNLANNSYIFNLNLAEIHKCQGEIYLTQKKAENALEELMISISILDKYLLDFKDHGTVNTCTRNSLDTQGIVLQKLVATYESVIIIFESRNTESKEKIELYGKLCDAYIQLSNYSKALPWYEKTLAAQEVLGEHELSVSATLHNLGNCYSNIGMITHAVNRYERSLKISVRLLGDEHESVVDTMYSLARSLSLNSKFDISLAIYRKVLNERKRTLGEDSHEVAMCYQAMGTTLALQGQYDKGLEACYEGLRLIRKNHREKDPIMFESFLCMGQIYSESRQYEKALLHYTKAIQCLEANTTQCLLEIGIIYETRGELSRSREYFTQSILAVQKKIGLPHSFIGDDANNVMNKTLLKFLTDLSKDQGQLLDFADNTYLYGILLDKHSCGSLAVIVFDFVLVLLSDMLEPTTLRFGDLFHQKGLSLARSGQYRQAVPTLSKALEIRRNLLDSNCSRIHDTSKILAECHSQLGNIDEAMTLFPERKQNKLLPLTSEPDEDIESDALLNKGHIYYSKLEFSKALEYYSVYLCITKRVHGSIHDRYGEGIHKLGEVFFGMGNDKKALINFELAIGIFEKNDSSLIYDTLLSMGALFYKNNRFRDCVDCCKRCIKIQEQKNEPEGVVLGRALTQLSLSYFKMRAFNEATQTQTRALDVIKESQGNCTNVALCWYSLAEILLEEKKAREALSCFQNALQIMSNSLDEDSIEIGNTLHGIGVCLLNLDEDLQAISSFSEGLKIRELHYSESDENVAETRRYLARAQLNLGDEEAALRNFDKVIDIKMSRIGSCPGDDEGDANKIIECVEAALIIVRNRVRVSHIECAEYLQKKGICEAILKKFDTAIDAHAKSIKIFNKINDKGHEKDIFVGNALFNIGVCMNEKGDPDKAIKYLEKASTMISRNLGEDHLHIADITFQIGISFKLKLELDDAKKCFEGALKIMEQASQYESTKAANILEIIGDMAIQEQELEIAERYLCESLRIKARDPDVTALQFKLGSLHKTKGDTSTAIWHYEECLMSRKIKLGDRHADVVETYLHLGVAHDLCNDFTKALSCYDFCIKSEDLAPVTSRRAYANKARILSRSNDLDEALACFEKAIQMGNDTYSEEEAEIISDKGQIYEWLGDEENALYCYESALSIFQSSVDSNNTGTAGALQRIADLLIHREDFDDALQFMADSLKVRQTLFGNDHKDTCKSLLGLGTIFFHSTKYDLSQKYLEQALNILKKLKGENYLMVANATYFIGCIQYISSNNEDALVSLQESLVARKKIPHVNIQDSMMGKTLHQLGKVHKVKQEIRNAATCLKECVKIYSVSLGPNHIEMANVLVDLAEIFHAQEKSDEALHVFNETLEVYKINLGEESPAIAKCHGLIGEVYDGQNETSKAISRYKVAIEMYTALSVTTADTQNTALKKSDQMFHVSTLHKLASALDRSGDMDGAVKSYSNAMQLNKDIMCGTDNLFAADLFENLANLRGRQNKFDKAFVLLKEALQIRTDILGPHDLSIASTLYSLGIVYDNIQESDAALRAFVEALDVYQRNLGNENVQCADLFAAIGTTFGNSGDLNSAIGNWRAARDIYTITLGYLKDNPKVVALNNKEEEASRLLSIKKTDWNIFR